MTIDERFSLHRKREREPPFPLLHSNLQSTGVYFYYNKSANR
jgi:hypothetical protein